MARHVHLVLSLDTEGEEPEVHIHAAFARQVDAREYERRLNADQADDERKAFLDDVTFCSLRKAFLMDKMCFRVQIQQKSMTVFGAVVAHSCPMINTASTSARFTVEGKDSTFPEGAHVFEWTGWARDRIDAIKRARLVAMSSWVRL